ncbi:MAG: AraC family transcriptional regulator [Bacteroidales bacterium]|jgi:AraC-like DNA-binding protein|nr:AraC family transcriptional regulator [Bacteroidales bacterium]MBR6864103.1 AraC family transcriptional regulator [Bacteroidales bacterium]
MNLMPFFTPVVMTGVYLLGRRRALRESTQRQPTSLAKKEGNTESQADGPGAVDQFLYDRCCRYMADRKPFLVESFSLGDLANVLFTNKVYLSKTINYYSGKNFRNYINYYRVMYAMELFRKNKSLTVTELGSLAGFHSGTTFNQAFKAVMQESPSTWCARLRKKNREYPK